MRDLTIAVFIGLVCLVACEPLNRYLSWEDENIFEETGEFIFEKQTGLDVDFTPTSPEK